MSTQKISIQIDGMKDQSCVVTVTNLIQFERGIHEVFIDLQKGVANVTGDEKMNKEQIIQSINLSKVYNAS